MTPVVDTRRYSLHRATLASNASFLPNRPPGQTPTAVRDSYFIHRRLPLREPCVKDLSLRAVIDIPFLTPHRSQFSRTV